jgi:hypothetical protein
MTPHVCVDRVGEAVLGSGCCFSTLAEVKIDGSHREGSHDLTGRDVRLQLMTLQGEPLCKDTMAKATRILPKFLALAKCYSLSESSQCLASPALSNALLAMLFLVLVIYFSYFSQMQATPPISSLYFYFYRFAGV